MEVSGDFRETLGLSHTEEGTNAEGLREQGAAEDIWVQYGRDNWETENTA